jgi:hypothetical protein
MRRLPALAALLFAAGSPRSDACTRDQLAFSCDKAVIAPMSYRLTTEAVALGPRSPAGPEFWERFGVAPPRVGSLRDADEVVTFAASNALAEDTRNQMAHSILARQALMKDDGATAAAAWHRAMVGGAPLVWRATIRDLGSKERFLAALGYEDLRIYLLPEAGPELPEPNDERLLTALGGCIDPSFPLALTLPWSAVRAVEARPRALRLLFRKPVSATTGRRIKALRRIDIALGGLRDSTLLQRTLERHIDPARRVLLTH